MNVTFAGSCIALTGVAMKPNWKLLVPGGTVGAQVGLCTVTVGPRWFHEPTANMLCSICPAVNCQVIVHGGGMGAELTFVNETSPRKADP